VQGTSQEKSQHPLLLLGRLRERIWVVHLWCESIQEAASNYREVRNLVNAMVWAANEGRLDGCEVFLYSDNQTSEGAYVSVLTGSPATPFVRSP
jgi:hypothetical protein